MGVKYNHNSKKFQLFYKCKDFHNTEETCCWQFVTSRTPNSTTLFVHFVFFSNSYSNFLIFVCCIRSFWNKHKPYAGQKKYMEKYKLTVERFCNKRLNVPPNLMWLTFRLKLRSKVFYLLTDKQL